jgi:glycosyltransferase involved in cell wall biosynthesis
LKDLISIIVPCYNQGQFLEETLISVKNQSYKNWECLIINDGSTDETKIVSKKWVDKDSRFKYFEKVNGGLSSARNLGLKNAKGKFIHFLDSDDIIDKNKIRIQLISMIDNKSKIDICDYIRFEDKFNTVINDRISPFFSLEKKMNSIILDWERELSIPCHCVIFRKELLNKGDDLFFDNVENHEDWIFWVKLFYRADRISFTKYTFAKYRVHDKSMSRNQVKMNIGFKVAAKTLLKYFDEKKEKHIVFTCQEKLKTLEHRTELNIYKFFKKLTPPLFLEILRVFKN